MLVEAETHPRSPTLPVLIVHNQRDAFVLARGQTEGFSGTSDPGLHAHTTADANGHGVVYVYAHVGSGFGALLSRAHSHVYR